MHHKREDSGLYLRAVDERQAFLGAERVRSDAGLSQRGCRIRPFATRYVHLPFTHHDTGDMTERGEVSACPDTSLLRHDRNDARIDQADQHVEQRRANSARWTKQHVGPEQHAGAHDVRRQGISQAGAVTANEIDLEAVQRIR